MGNFKETRDMNGKLLLVCIVCMAAYAHASSATVKYYSDKKCTTAITNGTACANPAPTCTSLKTSFKQPNAACKVSKCSFSFTGMGNTNCATTAKAYDAIGCAAVSFANPVSYRKIVVTCGGAATVGMSALAGIAALFSFFN